MTARSEDRGVQVEARTLSGVHIGKRVRVWEVAGTLASVQQWPKYVWFHIEVSPGVERQTMTAPTDLVTLTDGGAR